MSGDSADGSTPLGRGAAEKDAWMLGLDPHWPPASIALTKPNTITQTATTMIRIVEARRVECEMLIPMFIQDHAGGVPAGDSHYAAAGVGRAAADIHIF